jgi:hypothetical protein
MTNQLRQNARILLYALVFAQNDFSHIGNHFNLNNKLSLVGIQLPEKYTDNFDVSSEGP